jgi:hypothetical protein
MNNGKKIALGFMFGLACLLPLMHSASATAWTLKYDYSLAWAPYSAGPGETIEWSYSSNNTGFGVYVIALDQLNFPNFPNGTFTGFPLYTGTGHSEYGSFDVPYDSSWHIGFVNNATAAIGKQISLTANAYVNDINVTGVIGTVSGQPSTVTWVLGLQTTTNNVNISLYHNGGFDKTIANGIAASAKSYGFTMPNVTAGIGYTIMILDAKDTNTNSSSQMFTITPSATIISPIKTTAWVVGTIQDITYAAYGSSSVSLFLDKGGNGSLSMEIATGTSNNGSYPWLVSTGLPAGNDYSIELQVSESYAVYSETFSIDLPTITIQSPVPDSSYAQGSILPINYTALGVSTVDIYLYNGTILLKNIALDVPSNGSYSWTIPTSIGTGANYFVKIVDDDNASIVGLMPSGFTITAASSPPAKTPTVPGFDSSIIGFLLAIATCALVLKMARVKKGTFSIEKQ